MTTKDSALHNRISTKCHFFVRHYYPDVYRLLAKAAEEEYTTHQFRRNGLDDLKTVLQPLADKVGQKAEIVMTWDPDRE